MGILQDSGTDIVLTGGTLTMGYVKGSFLKQLSSDYASLLDDEHYLYPLYDIRHIVLAACVDASTELSQPEKNKIYSELVETGPLIQERLLAEKGDTTQASRLGKQLDERLAGVADEIQKGLSVEKALATFQLSRDHVTTPYFIDSINYDEREHDEKLYQVASNALREKQGKTFFVCGGTDTLTMYAGKVTRRLIDEGIITESNGNKVIFISAMQSFGYGPEGVRETPESEIKRWHQSQGAVPRAFRVDIVPPVDPHITAHPQHIGRLFRRVMTLATDEGKKLPAGGYLVCPQNELCEAVGIHDVRESMKVQSHFIDAFRSRSWYVGVIEEGQPLKINPEYHSTFKATSKPGGKIEHVEIAPPLINGNSTSAILQYLQKMHDYPVIVVGGIPTYATVPVGGAAIDMQAIDTVAPSTPCIPLDRADEVSQAILNVIRERAERGVPTYFANPDIYDVNTNKVHPLIYPERWEKNWFLQEVKQAGGILKSGETLAGCYHDIQRQLEKLSGVKGREKIEQVGGKITRASKKGKADSRIPMVKGDPIGIQYIPDKKAFTAGLKAAMGTAKTVVISALPGAVTPGYVADIIKDRPKGHNVMAGYEYANSRRRWVQFTQDFSDLARPTLITPSGNGRAVMTYAPAEAFVSAGGGLGGDYSPAEIMEMLQRSAGLDGLSQAMAAIFSGPGRSSRPSGRGTRT